MGFCMETAGMTQGDQGDLPPTLEMDRGFEDQLEVLKDASESMEEDQDPEVRNVSQFSLRTESIYRKYRLVDHFENSSCSKQFGPMTVEIKSQKVKTAANEAPPRAPKLKEIVDVDPLLQGQALLAAGKKRKKQQKRAGLYKIQHLYVNKVNYLVWFAIFLKIV